MRFMRMAGATYSVLSERLRSRWHTAPFVQFTIGVWRRISTHGALNGVLLGGQRHGDNPSFEFF